ncbi:hypothetical protein CGCTS75_v007137 [Colletotrichum tropicale]|nr:hypothetical protein CGCTS75_v007137 [Colletotrichum tropicale]
MPRLLPPSHPLRLHAPAPAYVPHVLRPSPRQKETPSA